MLSLNFASKILDTNIKSCLTQKRVSHSKSCFQNFGHLLFPKVDKSKFAFSYKKEESIADSFASQ